MKQLIRASLFRPQPPAHLRSLRVIRAAFTDTYKAALVVRQPNPRLHKHEPDCSVDCPVCADHQSLRAGHYADWTVYATFPEIPSERVSDPKRPPNSARLLR